MFHTALEIARLLERQKQLEVELQREKQGFEQAQLRSTNRPNSSGPDATADFRKIGEYQYKSSQLREIGRKLEDMGKENKAFVEASKETPVVEAKKDPLQKAVGEIKDVAKDVAKTVKAEVGRRWGLPQAVFNKAADLAASVKNDVSEQVSKTFRR